MLVGGTGNDGLRGAYDADELYPGPGRDRVGGGADDDLLVTTASPDAADAYRGGDGTDTITYDGRTGDVRVTLDRRANDGEADEHDLVSASVENVITGSGDDRIKAWAIEAAGDNELASGDGDDRIFAGSGADTLTGGAGDDELWGDTGDDVVWGGDGDDHVEGSSGDDSIVAEATFDGRDRYVGGDGTDTVTYAARTTHVKLSIGFAGSGAVDEHDRIDASVEVLVGGSGPDRLIGSEVDEVLVGGEGRDRLDGDAGADRLSGGGGNDAIVGGDGFDRIWGDGGDDVLHLLDGGADIADCGDGIDDVSDRDAVDTALVACEVT